MTYNWVASARRFMKTLSGAKRIDKVPFFALIMEQMITRIVGITVKELYSSPETYAKSVIMAYEFIGTDQINIPTSYPGPTEGIAFAEANDIPQKEIATWYDYKPISITQGAICKKDDDIDKLNVPDHSKIKIWGTSFSAAKIVLEKTKFPQIPSFGIWSVVQELRGIQAYKDIRRNPDLLLKLCEKVYESQMDILRLWTEMVNPSPFIFVPAYSFNKTMMKFEDAMKYEGQFIQRMQKELGNPGLILHNCGVKPYVEEVCKEINFVGVHCSHPLNINYWIEFQKNFPSVTIMGANIDVSRELFTGTPEIVEEKVKENIFNLAPNGRYICAPVCALPWGVPLPNIFTLKQSIDKYGKYPIK